MKYFSIHGIVGISVSKSYKWTETLIPNIPMFKTDADNFSHIKTKISLEYNDNVVKLDNFYEVVPNIFINRNTNEIFDKEYGALITRKKDGYSIVCSQECNEWLMMVLEYCLLANGATLVHSAGVEKNGKAYIFPSWGGVGKTASIAKLVREEGYHLLGDDLTILKTDGSVLAFPKKFVLYDYHRKLFSDAMSGTPLVKGGISNIASKMIPGVKAFLRKFPGVLAWARRHNPQSKRVSPYDIFGGDVIATGGKLEAVTWLERIHIPRTKKVDADTYALASKSLIITIHELFEGRIQEFMIALCAGDFDYKPLFDDSIKFIEMAMKKSKTCQLFIPANYPIESVASDVVNYTKSLE